MKNILSEKEIVSIKKSGAILAKALANVVLAIKPGIKTEELDQLAEDLIVQAGAKPAFKDYFIEGVGRYPATLCISVNHHVVHGLPGNYVLKEGDIISLDIGAEYEGMFTDMATTVGVGQISKEAEGLIKTTESCLYTGIDQAKLGNRIGDIGHSIQKLAESRGYGVVRNLVGHGIGSAPHLPPQIPNFGSNGEGEIIKEGMALAIEPMITLGSYEVKTLPDGWTIATLDESLAAHFEHTIVIEHGNPVIVTKTD